jgi:CheY-like chemotaxis protein
LFDAANVKNNGCVTFSVDIVGNAADALSQVAMEPSRYALILLDMLLPDLNGYDLLPKLRALTANDVAIVMASVASQTELVQLCVRRGADAFLFKPLGSEEVRHIWQFVKELPDGSFKDDVTCARPSIKAASTKHTPPSDTEDQGTSTSPPAKNSVLDAVKELDKRSVLVCAGCATNAPTAPSPLGAHAAGAANTAGMCSSASGPCSGQAEVVEQDELTSLAGSPKMRRRPPPKMRPPPSQRDELFAGIAHVRYPHAPSAPSGRGVPRRTSGESAASQGSSTSYQSAASLNSWLSRYNEVDGRPDGLPVAANCAQQ